MTEEFAFNARQYFDFNKGTDDLNDSYFDTNFEENETPTIPCPKLYEDITEDERQPESDNENEFFFSPVESGISGSTIYIKSKVRKSLSMGNLIVDNGVDQAKLSENINDAQISNQPQRGNSLTSLNGRYCSQEHINRLAQPKRANSTNSLTLAEAVVKFQAGTPKRFRSKPSPHLNKAVQIPRIGTKPHSPKLRTTTRTRPITAISHEEQEQKEIEKMKKYKIKAQPVSKRVLKGPLKPPIGKKVVSESTHVAETEKKRVEEHTVQTYRAQLVPKLPAKVQVNSQPSTRKFPKTSQIKQDNDGSKDKSVQHVLKPTLPKPFSFDKRDQQLIKKKEEFINKVLEEEKKAREFHARPLPKSILRSRNSNLDENSGSGSINSSKCSTEDLSAPAFKAKPATVLQQKPFVPKKSDHHIAVETFRFSTDQRLEARHKFEEKLKEKEALAEAHKREQEEYLKKLEAEEIARLRKQMEHKAQPIKKYKEIKIEHSKKVTEAISPKFYTNNRIKNKENIH